MEKLLIGIAPSLTASLISAAATLAVCMINNNAQAEKVRRKHERTIELIDYRLTELTLRVDKHNRIIERTYELEKRTELNEERLKSTARRLDALETAREGGRTV